MDNASRACGRAGHVIDEQHKVDVARVQTLDAGASGEEDARVWKQRQNYRPVLSEDSLVLRHSTSVDGEPVIMAR
jgi:hypothetical protein